MRSNACAVPEPQLDAVADEAARLEAVDRFNVLDTPREEGFDGIVRLIRNIFQVPVGLVSVIDGHRQWYKAWEGLEQREVARGDTLCDMAIRRHEPLVVEDASADARFADNPYVAGEPHIRFYAGVPLVTRDGHVIGTLCAIDFKPRRLSGEQMEILTDLARVAMAEFELRRHVAVDALTGVMSRRIFRDEAADTVGLARRHGLDLACIAFDIDHFKQVNDAFGHAAGDRVLEAVGNVTRGMLRRTDLIGRLGGEEFAIVLPHTDLRGAMEVAERLRAAVEGVGPATGLSASRVTASFGVAAMDEETDDFDALMERADSALYAAKSGGRNRCSAWRDEDGLRKARRRVLKAGLIHFNQRMSTVDCTVRTLSQDGAGIDLASSYGLPERFGLAIRSDGTDRACRIVWQSERHVEVEFV
jgi:diguanylate cyclase (GGDEF)-like protein